MKIFLLFLLTLNLVAQDDYSFRAAYGKASDNDLGDIISGDMSQHNKDLSVIALDGGYLLKESLFELPLDIYIKGNLSRYDESAANVDNVYEVAVYVKAYWNFDFLDNRVRFGFGEGISYTDDILFVEEEDTDDGKTSYLLNYLDISLDFDFGRLINYEPLHETYVGWALKHRSGVFGLFNGVNGGSNYNTIYIEKNF